MFSVGFTNLKSASSSISYCLKKCIDKVVRKVHSLWGCFWWWCQWWHQRQKQCCWYQWHMCDEYKLLLHLCVCSSFRISFECKQRHPRMCWDLKKQGWCPIKQVFPVFGTTSHTSYKDSKNTCLFGIFQLPNIYNIHQLLVLEMKFFKIHSIFTFEFWKANW